MKKLRFCSDLRTMALAAGVVLLLTDCEKAIIDEDAPGKAGDADANVTLRIGVYQQSGFAAQSRSTRAASALTNQLSRLSVAVFGTDGKKVKSINQEATDASFGTVGVSLDAGIYRVVAIAHNGEGNATLSSTEKVTFASNKVTDTFAYCGTIEVDGDVVDETLELQRVVSMVRLDLADPLPSEVQRLMFYYTGGSSTLNPMTGYGCVNSKQTEYRYTTDASGSAVSTYEIYTMPHEQSDVLKVVVTALAEDGTTIKERTLEDVPVVRNKITTWTGNLFGIGNGTTTTSGFGLTLDTSWDGYIDYKF